MCLCSVLSNFGTAELREARQQSPRPRGSCQTTGKGSSRTNGESIIVLSSIFILFCGQKRYEQSIQALEDAQFTVDTADEIDDDLRDKHQKLKEVTKENREKLKKLRKEVQQVKENVKSLEESHQVWQSNMESHSPSSITKQCHRLSESIEKCKRRIQEADQQRREAEVKVADLSPKVTEAQSSLTSTGAELHGAESKADQIESDIRAARESQRDSIHSFGHASRQVSERLGSNWTGSKPIGPIGRHVQIKPEHQKWSTCIESVLGPQLNGWIVTTNEDKVKLSKLFGTTGLKCAYLIPAVLCP